MLHMEFNFILNALLDLSSQLRQLSLIVRLLLWRNRGCQVLGGAREGVFGLKFLSLFLLVFKQQHKIRNLLTLFLLVLLQILDYLGLLSLQIFSCSYLLRTLIMEFPLTLLSFFCLTFKQLNEISYLVILLLIINLQIFNFLIPLSNSF